MQDPAYIAQQIATFASWIFIIVLISLLIAACTRPHYDPRPVKQERYSSSTQRMSDGDKAALNEAEVERLESGQ